MGFKVLAVGDVVGNPGVKRISQSLRKLKRETKADFVVVNGENASPLFEYLKNEQPFKDITGKGATKLKLVLKATDRHYKDNNDIKWNFTKFLVDREGNVVRRFEPTEDLDDVKAAVKELL